MMPATEALSLPSAAIKPSDAEVANKFLIELEAFVRENMTRNGCQMPIDPTKYNPQIVAEVERACRKQKWTVAFTETRVPSPLSNGGYRVAGHQIQLTPMDECYSDVIDIPPPAHANGVALRD